MHSKCTSSITHCRAFPAAADCVELQQGLHGLISLSMRVFFMDNHLIPLPVQKIAPSMSLFVSLPMPSSIPSPAAPSPAAPFPSPSQVVRHPPSLLVVHCLGASNHAGGEGHRRGRAPRPHDRRELQREGRGVECRGGEDRGGQGWGVEGREENAKEWKKWSARKASVGAASSPAASWMPCNQAVRLASHDWTCLRPCGSLHLRKTALPYSISSLQRNTGTGGPQCPCPLPADPSFSPPTLPSPRPPFRLVFPASLTTTPTAPRTTATWLPPLPHSLASTAASQLARGASCRPCLLTGQQCWGQWMFALEMVRVRKWRGGEERG